MKIKGLVETSFVDWPGLIAAVVFLGRCNFRCPYCHNHELVLAPETLPGRPPGEVLDQLKPLADWLDGVVITGGEPTLTPGLDQLCRLFKEEGFKVKLDTNGSRPEVIRELTRAGLIDAVSMDLKAPLSDEVLHRRLAGVAANLTAIQASIDLLLASGLEVEFRTTIVPGLLTEEHLKIMAGQIKGARRWKLNHFRPLTCLDPDFHRISPLSETETAGLQNLVDSWLKERV